MDDAFSDYAATELGDFTRETLFQDWEEGTETYTAPRRQPPEPEDVSDSGAEEICVVKANVGLDNPKVRGVAPREQLDGLPSSPLHFRL